MILRYTFFLFFLTISLVGTAQEIKTDSTEHHISTYYFIRHAEKDTSDKSNRNPSLTRKGYFRAESWAEVFENIELDAIYSTNYNRTLLTASPTAQSQNIEITLYDPSTFSADELRKAQKGKNILIVGHSNTTPQLVNDFLGEKKYSQMNENDNSSLYVVKIMDAMIDVEILKIN